MTIAHTIAIAFATLAGLVMVRVALEAREALQAALGA